MFRRVRHGPFEATDIIWNVLYFPEPPDSVVSRGSTGWQAVRLFRNSRNSKDVFEKYDITGARADRLLRAFKTHSQPGLRWLRL